METLLNLKCAYGKDFTLVFRKWDKDTLLVMTRANTYPWRKPNEFFIKKTDLKAFVESVRDMIEEKTE